MDGEGDPHTEEFPPVFEEDCPPVANIDRSERSRLQESQDSGYEASPIRNSCQEIFIFSMDTSTDDVGLCATGMGEQWSADENNMETTPYKSDSRSSVDHSCLCVCGESQNCCSHTSSGSLQTRNALWSSVNAFVRPSSFPLDCSPRTDLFSSSDQSFPTLRPFQSQNINTHSVHIRCGWTVNEGPLPPVENQYISVATQTNVESLRQETYSYGSVDDPVFQNQDSNSPLMHRINRSLPDVVQTPRIQSRTRSQSVNLPLDEWIQETGSILRELSENFEGNRHEPVSIPPWMNRILSWSQSSNRRQDIVRRRPRFHSSSEGPPVDM
ncbi:uncharacterized protein LOC111086358 [Limulus polyphemus]|uniref:Uncharacterized protein LOC111086358 n=1 Tax=Limulus polyphemus TaxID=6850 RepID=A0ABM1SLV9_LIMPO|nr:uncharacterized protein LOC111086358 [Limulus polyphemus]XP_022244617.1 uncharacterized protein LOC111086358 [Limulus polyphemus]